VPPRETRDSSHRRRALVPGDRRRSGWSVADPEDRSASPQRTLDLKARGGRGEGGSGKRQEGSGERTRDYPPPPLPSLVVPAVSAANEILDAHETPVRRALRTGKSGRDSMIAHPYVITKT